MARMIPPQIEFAAASAAERRVFNFLSNDPGTDGWTALHSLGLARRRAGPYGEIDFVVMIPGEGIVCLEVKGGRVSCENGNWRTMDRNGVIANLKMSPFMQAREAMFALKGNIKTHFGQGNPESKCPIGYAVVFPDVECPPATPEFEPADAIDVKDLLERPISESINRVVRSRLREFQSRGGERYPTPPQLKAILEYLRRDFESAVTESVHISRTEEKLFRWTKEQSDCLSLLKNNRRCLFEGAAGTGKTLLALEYARQANESGEKVLFLCFNRPLGDWLKKQKVGEGVEIGTWHSAMGKFIYAGSDADEFEEYVRKKPDDDFHYMRKGFSFYGELALEDRGDPFDVLVIDEAQDFNKDMLDPLNKAIKGGLADGKWVIFGDFHRQALYGKSSDPRADLSRFCGPDRFTKAELRINCRNTRGIAKAMAIIGDLDKPLRNHDQEEEKTVKPVYLKKGSDAQEELQNTVRRLMENNVSMDDVIILSRYNRQNPKSVLAGVEQIQGFQLVDFRNAARAARKHIKFSTIHAFKGLESPVVILVDIDQVDDHKSQSLLYVGMSRARSLLIMLIDSKHSKWFRDRKDRWDEKNPS